MEIVVLLSYIYSKDFYCWGLLLAGQVTSLIFEEMAMEVEDFGSDFEVVDSAEDFVEEENLDMMDNMDKMVDIDNTERTYHKDFVLLEPNIEIDFEIGAKVVAKNSNLVGVDYTYDY